jgi:hypothetical protein
MDCRHPISPRIVAAVLLWAAVPGFAANMPVLGAADGFAVLAGTGITISTATTVTGDIGTYPTETITGMENLTLYGTNYTGESFMPQVMADLLTAYNYAAGLEPTMTYSEAMNLGGLTLDPGIYRDTSSFAIAGTLTLDAGNDPSAFWVFQAGTTLNTATDSLVVLTNGAQASHVFWQVGSSATVGVNTDFAGIILASESITLNSGAVVDGQVLAYNGAVTLDNNNIAVPEASTLLLLGPGLALPLTFRRRRRTLA